MERFARARYLSLRGGGGRGKVGRVEFGVDELVVRGARALASERERAPLCGRARRLAREVQIQRGAELDLERRLGARRERGQHTPHRVHSPESASLEVPSRPSTLCNVSRGL